jgi:hypothetical protein
VNDFSLSNFDFFVLEALDGVFFLHACRISRKHTEREAGHGNQEAKSKS